jgi:hypothetical protein
VNKRQKKNTTMKGEMKGKMIREMIGDMKEEKE